MTKGAWDVSQAPGMCFSFFFFIYYYTNIYLLLNRLCIPPHHQHQPPLCITMSPPSPTTPWHIATSPPTPITLTCCHNANNLNSCYITTSTHHQHQHTTLTHPTTWPKPWQGQPPPTTTTIATDNNKRGLRCICISCPWYIFFFFIILSYYFDTN